MIYCRKSYYTGLDSYSLGKLSFLFLQLVSLTFMQYSYNIGFITLNISSTLYFIFHMLHVKIMMSNHETEITKNHTGRVKAYKVLLLTYVIYTVGLILEVIIFSKDLSVLWWIGTTAIMTYAEAVTISSLVAFGENGYMSGDYYVPYNNIDKICEEKSMNSVGGEIVLITFWKNKKKIGFDKMFIDEYHELRLHIYQGQES
ncbi:MAG: hypothetical protein ACI4D2_05775 [Lachnospiraceae bacterium]